MMPTITSQVGWCPSLDSIPCIHPVLLWRGWNRDCWCPVLQCPALGVWLCADWNSGKEPGKVPLSVDSVEWKTIEWWVHSGTKVIKRNEPSLALFWNNATKIKWWHSYWSFCCSVLQRTVWQCVRSTMVHNTVVTVCVGRSSERRWSIWELK